MGEGASANLAQANSAHANEAFDGADEAPGLGNVWIDNHFGTTFGI